MGVQALIEMCILQGIGIKNKLSIEEKNTSNMWPYIQCTLQQSREVLEPALLENLAEFFGITLSGFFNFLNF